MTNATPATRASRKLRERPWFRSSTSKRWPPYELLEQSIEEQAEDRMRKLERLYHKGQDHAWDGKAVLAQLIDEHGPPRLPEDKKDSALTLLSVLLWGELAAWAISADLAERIDDVEAKMAATSQAHDEARHFYVLRDYMRACGEQAPRLGGIGRRLLVGILETDSLVHKLIGMQLLVESNALAIFKEIGEADIEPVLTGLIPYYERDEARHVGLGILYLPRLLRDLSRVEAARVSAFQLRCVGLLITAGLPLRPHLRALGMEPRNMAARTVKMQDEIMGQMRAAAADQGLESFAGLGGLLNPGKGVGPAVLNFIHPPGGPDTATPLNRAVMRILTEGAQLANRALA